MNRKTLSRLNVKREPNQGNIWEQKFKALCYEVFYRNPQGKELLLHLENRYFRSPVAAPGQDPSWGWFNEGRNELIRSFSQAIIQFMNESQSKSTGSR